MSVKRTVSISLASQVFFVATRILVVPVYLRLMGVEAYGLVGLFVLFTAIIQLFNFGISSTTSREIARMGGGAVNSATVRHYLGKAFILLATVSLGFAAAIAVLAPVIATRWLHVTSITSANVTLSIRLMGAAAAFTFISGLFKGGLLGLEKQIFLNAMNSLIAALRSFGAIAVLVFVAPTPVAFCAYQLVISIVELAVFHTTLYRFVPPAAGTIDNSDTQSSGLRRFAGGLAFTDLVWAGVMQLDRLVLSTALPLAQFGYFTVMSTAAYGVLLLTSPIMQTLQPRFTVLAAEGRHDELRGLYLRVSYGVTALVSSGAGTMAFFSWSLVYAWTGNPSIAHWSATVMPLYAIGNALVGVLSLPFLLQFALGDIKLHIWAHIVDAVVYIPLAVWLGLTYGAQGTGAAWLAMNAIYLLVLIPVIHARVLPGWHWRWFFGTICPAFLLPMAMLMALSMLPLPSGRLPLALAICAYGGIALVTTILANRDYRGEVTRLLSGGSGLLRPDGKVFRAITPLLRRIWLGRVRLENAWRRSRPRNRVMALLGSGREKRLASSHSGRFILFLVPGVDIVNGGIMSIFSIAAESEKLTAIHGARVAICTAPGEPLTRRFTKFENKFYIYSFAGIVSHLPRNAEVLVQVPEMGVRPYVTEKASAFAGRPDIRWTFNVLLQNIDFSPTSDDIVGLHKMGPVTVTTAHAAYANPQTAERLGCAVHHLSTWVCPEIYDRTGYKAKSKLIMISPDLHDAKDALKAVLAAALPDHRIVEIKRMTYKQYLDIARRAKFAFTFGEGLDGYFVEPVLSGGIGMAIYNDRFFTEEYRDLAGVFASEPDAIASLIAFMRNADNEAAFNRINSQQFAVVSRNYIRSEYLENLRSFYSRYFQKDGPKLGETGI
jgi:O-antigen/teichoic acid export membrane protein